MTRGVYNVAARDAGLGREPEAPVSRPQTHPPSLSLFRRGGNEGLLSRTEQVSTV